MTSMNYSGQGYVFNAPVTLQGNPSADLQAAPKQYVDARSPKTGFDTTSTSTLTFVAGTRVVTLAPTATNFDVYVNGTKYTKTSQTTTIPNTTGAYFVYFDSSGTFTQSTTWDVLTTAPVIYVYWDSGLADGFAFEERHGSTMDPATHKYLHNTNGTEIISGFAASGYDLAGAGGNATNAFNTFAIAAGVVADEDINFTTSALSDGVAYTIFNRTGATGTWTWTKTNTIPHKVGTTFPQYNQWTGATWQLTEGQSLRYYNYFVFATTSLDAAFQIIIIPGQLEHSSLAAAQTETYASLSYGTLPFQEIAPLYQVTLRTGTGVAYNGATGSCRIEAFSRIVGSKYSVSNFQLGAHNSLTGIQGGAAGDYFHLTSAQATIATQAATTSLSGYLTSTDWNTFNGKFTPGTALSATTGTFSGLVSHSMTSTTTSGNLYSIDNQPNFAASGASSANMIGFNTLATTGNGDTIAYSGNISGAAIQGRYRGNTAGSILNIIGLDATSYRTGTGTVSGYMAAIRTQISNSTTGTIPTAYSVSVLAPAPGTGTITNNYGINIADQGAAGITNGYGLYIASQTAGYSIYTNNGDVRLGGNLYSIGTANVFGYGAAASESVAICAAANTNRNIYFQSGSNGNRWALNVATGAESGSNAGATFGIIAYDDASALIDTPISIVRAAGGAITLSRPLSATTGTFSSTVTGTSFNSITGLSSTTPAALGTAAVGTGTTTARADHVHQMVKIRTPHRFYFEAAPVTTVKQPVYYIETASTLKNLRWFRDDATTVSGTTVFVLKKNGVTLYTLTIETAAASRTWSTSWNGTSRAGLSDALAAGDYIEITCSTGNTTMLNLTVQLDIEQSAY